MSTVVTHGAVSWTITETLTSGNFVNGEAWIVQPAGTLTVQSYTPTPTAGRNGSMKNNSTIDLITVALSARNGYDDRIGEATYSAANNIAHDGSVFTPFTLTANDMLFTCDSATTGDGDFDNIDFLGILVVLASAPAADAFCPPWTGWDGTTIHEESDIDWTKVPQINADAVPNVATVSAYESDIYEKTWVSTNHEWTGTRFHPPYMAGAGFQGYGGRLARKMGGACLTLCLNESDAAKRNLMIGVVQFAIHNQGIIDSGYEFEADGGIWCGRMAAHIVAACVLNDTAMKAALSGFKFQEAQQTFYVTQADVDITQSARESSGLSDSPWITYDSADIGMPEYGIEHSTIPAGDNNRWNAPYRDIAGGVTLEPALVAGFLGMHITINHDALYDYAKRHAYYRASRLANPRYYNGYDDGDAYGDGNNTGGATPWSANESTAFAQSMMEFYGEFYGPAAYTQNVASLSQKDWQWVMDDIFSSCQYLNVLVGGGATITASDMTAAGADHNCQEAATTQYNNQVSIQAAIGLGALGLTAPTGGFTQQVAILVANNVILEANV